MCPCGILDLATCQFAVGSDIRRNGRMIRRQIEQAAAAGARAVHFPEAALPGYAGCDYDTWEDFDWDTLKKETVEIMASARRRKMWVILGTCHRLSGRHLPHNSLYIINSKGELADRYDKRFCTGGDLRFYTPGDHFTVFTINGVRCGALICYDVRFPELYRAYRKLKVDLMFHSFYNARHEGRGILAEIMPANLQARAATDYMWVSAPNPTGYCQQWPSMVVRPDGHVMRPRLKRHTAGFALTEVNTREAYYDASGDWRERAMKGRLNSGRTVKDPRSRQRRRL